ncbi:type IVB secretion system protein IcmH/DotU [Cedecea sp.]|jgi:type VI secretion system protein ImpK|uniref:type IVB secretion system protein IcmH/DotU n=1 Tax=Cedecea sp. TaxID=1970739 RepID=UPI002F415917
MKRWHLRGKNDEDAAPAVLHQLAEKIFSESVRLRGLSHMSNLMALRVLLISLLEDFQRRAMDSGIDKLQIETAHYALCTLLDEAIGDTPWGCGVWGSDSLLMHCHGESHGGERFFVLLEQVEQSELGNERLLALFYLCLALGLEGRYRIQPDGVAQLTAIRRRLYQRVSQAGLEIPVSQNRCHLSFFSARRRMWIGGAALLALTVIVGMLIALKASVERQHLRLLDIITSQSAQPNLLHQLAVALATDVRNGALTLTSEGPGARITLSTSTFFASGSAEIGAPQRELLQRLSSSFRHLAVQIRVVGHSDNQSVGRKWQNNQVLSLARAKTVMKALTPPGAEIALNIVAEGRGADEPLVDNDNADNRARNRRVEIYITPID